MTYRFWKTLWRRRNLVLGVALLCILTGMTVAELQKNVFIGRAYFVPHSNFSVFLNAVQGVDADPVLTRIISDMKLLSLPEFNEEILADTMLLTALAQKINLKLYPAVSTDELYLHALEHMRGALRITPHPGLGFVEISFQSISPWYSHAIANNIADGYAAALSSDYEFKDNLSLNSSAKAQVTVKKAEKPETPARPPMAKFIISSLLIGLLIGSIAAMSAEHHYRVKIS